MAQTNHRLIGTGILLLFVLFGVALYFGVRALSGSGAKPPKKPVQIISLVTPPPPPPEQKMDQPPDPPLQEEIVVPEPADIPEEIPELADEPPAGDLLGLDADGSGTGDGFGLVGRKGGRGLLSGDPLAWYAGRIHDCLREHLQDVSDIKVTGTYSTVIAVRPAPTGGLRVEVESSTADDGVLAAIKRHLEQPVRCGTEPPLQAADKTFRIRMIAEGRS